MKNTNKKRLITLTLLALLAGIQAVAPTQAQILILDESEFNNNSRTSGSNGGMQPVLPGLNITTDQYSPLGGGEVLLLSCLGGAYLLSRRRKRER